MPVPTNAIFTDRRVRLPLAVGALMTLGAIARLTMINASFLVVGIAGPALNDPGPSIAERSSKGPSSAHTAAPIGQPGSLAEIGLENNPQPRAPREVAMFDPTAPVIQPSRSDPSRFMPARLDVQRSGGSVLISEWIVDAPLDNSMLDGGPSDTTFDIDTHKPGETQRGAWPTRCVLRTTPIIAG